MHKVGKETSCYQLLTGEDAVVRIVVKWDKETYTL